MPKVKCKERQCKYNNKDFCIKEGIYVRDDAICESFRLGKLDRKFAFEIASFEDDEKGIKCDATSCYHNKDHNCKANHIYIDYYLAKCRDYNPK